MKFIQKYEDYLLFSVTLLVISLCSLYNYLLFHTFAEFYSIVIGATIFIIVLNLKEKLEHGYFILLGIAYLFIAILDLIHTLAFKGMNIFIGYDANLPTQLWIAARYLESLSLIIALFFTEKQVNFYLSFSVYSFLTFLVLISIFVFNIFPDCYIEGVGLTDFKI